MDMTALAPGFASPVLDSQAVFRAVLEAMSRPACPVPCPRLGTPPALLYPATGAVMLALADLETPVWLDEVLDVDAVRAWLSFHCGCPFVSERSRATFALVGNPAAVPSLESFALGTQDGPDESTTVVIQVPGFRSGSGPRFSGPGIKDFEHLEPLGLAPRFWAEWADNAVLFPQGVDVLLTSTEALVGLPRTSKGEV